MFAKGYLLRIVFITPLPTTWFGRHANGCTQTIFGISFSMYSIISAVKNQPSPVWFPIDRISFTWLSKCQISQGIKYSLFDLYNAFFKSFSKTSIKLIAILLIFEDVLFVPSSWLNVILWVAINLMNPIKSGSTTSAPSLSNSSATKLFPKGWYFINTSPTIPTFGFSTDISSLIFSKSSTIS